MPDPRPPVERPAEDPLEKAVSNVMHDMELRFMWAATTGNHPDATSDGAVRTIIAPLLEAIRETLAPAPGDGEVEAEWDGERCQDCGQPYEYVWWCFDPFLWKAVTGHEKPPGDNAPGLLCIPCFDRRARDLCCWIEWAPLNLRHLERHPHCAAKLREPSS